MEIGDAANSKVLRKIAKSLLSLASEGDVSAIKEVADRLDGKSAQSVQVGGEDGGALIVEIVRLAENSNSKPVATPALSKEGLGLSGKGR